METEKELELRIAILAYAAMIAGESARPEGPNLSEYDYADCAFSWAKAFIDYKRERDEAKV